VKLTDSTQNLLWHEISFRKQNRQIPSSGTIGIRQPIGAADEGTAPDVKRDPAQSMQRALKAQRRALPKATCQWLDCLSDAWCGRWRAEGQPERLEARPLFGSGHI
jgi:hypothetical protein